MHVAAHLIPRHHKARAMGTEHRICRVVKVALRLVAHSFNNLRRIVAGPVAVQRQGQVSPAPGIAHHLHGVAAHGGHRCKTGEHSSLFPALWRVKTALHALDIGHGTAKVLHRHFQPKGIPWLQQLAFGQHQALPHRAIGGPPEISALRVFKMGAARNEG